MYVKIPVAHIWMTYKYIYDEFNGYRKLYGTEDYDFILRLISKGYKCSNISDYYGYRIRLNRVGNSSDIFGIRKLKSKNYSVKLYKERLKKGSDSYSVKKAEEYVKSNIISRYLYLISNKFLYKAFGFRAQKNYIGLLFCILCTLISPIQVRYLFESLKYKVIIKYYEKKV